MKQMTDETIQAAIVQGIKELGDFHDGLCDIFRADLRPDLIVTDTKISENSVMLSVERYDGYTGELRTAKVQITVKVTDYEESILDGDGNEIRPKDYDND